MGGRKERESVMKNRWMSVVKEIRLGELVKLIPDDEFVIIFDALAGAAGYPEEDAMFNGQAADWWSDLSNVQAGKVNVDLNRWRVVGICGRELETVAGPVIMIVAEP